VRVWDAATGELERVLVGHEDWVGGCAVGPDAQLVFSSSYDGTVRVWQLTDGAEVLVAPLAGAVLCVAAHPSCPVVACGGGFHIAELVGIDYGAIIVTARHTTDGLVVDCPACGHTHAVALDQLGAELTCVESVCGLRMRLNPFVVTQVGRA
jgi:hypothetical protein